MTSTLFHPTGLVPKREMFESKTLTDHKTSISDDLASIGRNS